MNLRLLILLFLIASLASTSGKRDLSLKKLLRELKKQLKGSMEKRAWRKNIKNLKKYKCHLTPTKKESESESWIVKGKTVFLKCDLALPNFISTVICDKKCTDPSTCKPMKGFQGKPFLHEFKFEPRSGKKNKPFGLQLPVTCFCEAKSKRN